jgi:hypothetical protein
MTSITVTSAAPDLSLLSIAELRSAAGVTDKSKDSDLLILGRRIAGAITAACNIARAGATPPTLRQETLSQQFRIDDESGELECLILARRPVVSIAAVTEDGIVLGENDYELDATAGFLYRLRGDLRDDWVFSKCVIVYQAGYAVVPEDLKLAAAKFVQAELSQGGRDPLLKSVSIEGVSTREYWVDPNKDSVIPGEVLDILQRGDYIETNVG